LQCQPVQQQQQQQEQQPQPDLQQQEAQQALQQLQPEQYQLETLTHMLLQCPTAVEVWSWFAGMWRRLQPDAEVDVSNAQVMLLDDSSVWSPPAPLQRLWTYLRLQMLESFWVVRCSNSGKPYSSSQVVSRFLAAMQQQLKQDWARTLGDIRRNSGVPLSWLRGRKPELSSEQFAAKWGAGGLLYVLVEGEGPRVCLIPLR
jgi:hypothetical protein